MERVYKASDIFQSLYYRQLTHGLHERPYKPTAWGYVYRPQTNPKEILVGNRSKSSDPKRKGQLAIPGGGVNDGESYRDAVVRETLEETGLKTLHQLTVRSKALKQTPNKALIRRTNRVFTIFDTNGRVWFEYMDSGKRYYGYVFELSPLFSQSTGYYPVEQEGSDLKDPRFIGLVEIGRRWERFTPVCRSLMKLILDHEQIEPISLHEYTIIEDDVRNFLPFEERK